MKAQNGKGLIIHQMNPLLRRVLKNDHQRRKWEQLTQLAGSVTDGVIVEFGDSGNIGKHFPYQCDLLFFDGDHREAGIRRDIETWLHTAKGSIAFHDYILDNPPARNQVAKVVDEMINLPTRLQVERLKVFETLDCRKS